MEPNFLVPVSDTVHQSVCFTGCPLCIICRCPYVRWTSCVSWHAGLSCYSLS